MTKILSFAVISIAIYFAIALGLILSQWPSGARSSDKTLDFDKIKKEANPWPVTQFTHSDQTRIDLRSAIGTDATKPLLVLVHGSGWYSQQFDALMPVLSQHADVIAPDLRGHGMAPTRRGDVDYIGQHEDDLAELIKAHQKPGQKVVMLGHSSGGGLVIRFAGGKHGTMMDHAILLAPFIHHRSPTQRANAGGWAHVLLRRMIGVSMLNMARLPFLNKLIVIEFNFPQDVLTSEAAKGATDAYSFRMNASYAPRNDYKADIAALPQFDLIAGEQDEAFHADQYKPLMNSVSSQGTYHMLSGLGHLDVVQAPETMSLITARLDEI